MPPNTRIPSLETNIDPIACSDLDLLFTPPIQLTIVARPQLGSNPNILSTVIDNT
jgi:hypothetical protein